MSNFRTNAVVFAVSFIAAALMLEFSGVRAAWGVSWTGIADLFPAWFVGPIALLVAVLWILNPSSDAR